MLCCIFWLDLVLIILISSSNTAKFSMNKSNSVWSQSGRWFKYITIWILLEYMTAAGVTWFTLILQHWLYVIKVVLNNKLPRVICILKYPQKTVLVSVWRIVCVVSVCLMFPGTLLTCSLFNQQKPDVLARRIHDNYQVRYSTWSAQCTTADWETRSGLVCIELLLHFFAMDA